MAAAMLGLALAALALSGSTTRAEVVQHGHLRVAFDGKLTPSALPRARPAPIGVELGGRVFTTDGDNPPQLRRISIAINRYGKFSPGSLPTCRIEEIQPATTQEALRACRSSLVGEGHFSAQVLLPEQSPFPSAGKVYAYNGTYAGRPAILAHVYGTEPAPTSYTLPFRISDLGGGTFGTLLSVSLPQATSEWGFVTGLELKIDRAFSRGGRRHGYVSGTCPAPQGFPGTVFPFARATFAFTGGLALRSTLMRSCKVRG